MRKICLMAAALGVRAAAGIAAEGPAGYSPDNEGFIRNWLLLDPIEVGEKAATHEEDSEKGFFDKEFFDGQNKAMPKLGDKVKVGAAEMVWKDNGDFALDLRKIAEDADMNDLKLKIGSDDSSCWWLNGKEVIRVYAGRGCEKDQDTKEGLSLKKGCNVLKFEVINGDGDYGACARFTDKNDKPLVDLKVALEPGGAPKELYPVDPEGFIGNWLVLDSIELGDTAATHEEDSQKEFFEKEYVSGQAGAGTRAGFNPWNQALSVACSN